MLAEGEAAPQGPAEVPARRASSHLRGGYFFFLVAIVGVIGVALLMYGRSRASLRVRANPPQATILVDEKAHGSGEIELRFLKPGWHSIKATLGELERERSILVEPGERRVITLELRRGCLRARSPSGAAVVTVEGSEEPLGLTPLGPVPVWAGMSVLRFSMPGFIERVETVAIAPGETVSMRVTLERGTGFLDAHVFPEDASLFLDGELRGQGPRLTVAVPAGVHYAEARAPGWSVAGESLSVDHGDTVAWTARLAAIPTGWLTVTSTPSGATVGPPEGEVLGVTPVDSIVMEPGSYVLRAEKPGFIPEEFTVTIEAGLVVAHDARLRPEYAVRPLAVNSRPTSTVLLDGKMVGETPMVLPEVRTGTRHVLTLLSSDGRSWSTEFVVSPREGGAHRISHDFMQGGEADR
jgi:hypothetical protein